ncbi:MAG: S8 family peptidase [Asticcacaulis sp.]|uniref:S8 family peptidase n=1 Tax=Asticcacaulis sp. TaxID=1872648 RepID=UPI0039E421EA
MISQFQSAFAEARSEVHDGVQRTDGSYFEIELRRGSDPANLDRKRDGVVSGATNVDRDADGNGGAVRTVVFIPDDAADAFEHILTDYRDGPLSDKGNPPNKSYVEPIEAIRRAALLSFWTDDASYLPAGPQIAIWWEVWCHSGHEATVAQSLRQFGCRVAEEDLWLKFPEATVVLAYARRADIELLIFSSPGVSELRRGSDSPTFFIFEERENQHAWAEDLAERTVWPGRDVPRVCILDTGVNRAHMLIEPALAERDIMTANPKWVATDNDAHPHGTLMAGLALHGDLLPALTDMAGRRLGHRLESVRIMPADGFPPNDPARLGSITQTAVSLAEIENPDQDRVFCMAITNRDHSGQRPTSWSACVDRTSSGVLDPEGRHRCLFMISAGNIPGVMNTAERMVDVHYPIEDPAQAWNALTIGGYTDKATITEPALTGYRPFSAVGDTSPYSRNSIAWRQNKSPMKPEVVFEAGNREARFKRRINAEEAEPGGVSNVADDGWKLGPRSISAGSLHCDVWTGSGAELAARNMICVKPVSGWWKERRTVAVHGQEARYALIVTLNCGEEELDLYTPIRTTIEQMIDQKVDIDIDLEVR